MGPFVGAAGSAPEGVPPVANAVAQVEATHGPRALLALLDKVEAKLGRDRSHPAHRALDLDLLDVGLVKDEGDLRVPHPRFRQRAFVLAPWEEVAPHHVPAGTGRTVLQHAAALRASRPQAYHDLKPACLLGLPSLAGACRVLEDQAALAAWRDACGGRVGLVPTMGALHAGHTTLLRRARAECDQVLATLFVNPLQFGAGEDLDRYPRTFEADRALMRAAGVDAVYAPRTEDLYPPGFATYVDPEGPARGLEGAERPGHFRGVATVVYKLWRRARPTRGYFGRKDAQQLAVIRRMVRDLELGGTVVPCPIVREADGLALSSRNRYLSAAERVRALGLSRTLEAMAFWAASGAADPRALQDEGRRRLEEAGLTVDYLRVVDPDTMAEADRLERPALAVATVRVGATRLLDNRWLVRAPRERGA